MRPIWATHTGRADHPLPEHPPAVHDVPPASIRGLPPYWPALAEYSGGFRLIQFGVRNTRALQRWELAFPQAEIIGVDPDPRSVERAGTRARVIVGSQSDSEMLRALALEALPTVVVDDGSRDSDDRLATLLALYPFLREGGTYVIEAIQAWDADDALMAVLRHAADDLSLERRESGPTREQAFRGFCHSTLSSVSFQSRHVVLRRGREPAQVFHRRKILDLGVDTHRVSAGSTYGRIPARLDGPIHAVEAAWSAIAGGAPVTPPDAVSAELRDVSVWGNRIVVTGDGHVIDETLNASRNVFRSGGLYRPFDDSVWVSETPFRVRSEFGTDSRYVLLMHTWDNNYGHWLIDGLPRLGLVDSFGDRGEFTYLLNKLADPAMTAVVVDSLGMCGVSPEQLRFLPYGLHHFERLLVPGALSAHPLTKSRLAIEFLEGLASTVVPGTDRRVYLTRSSVSRRRVVNEEEELLPLLAEFGFRVVAPETLPFSEQVSILAGADVVVGNMGAAMANVAFSPRGVTLLSLGTQVMPHDFFYDIVCIKDGRYRGLQGSAVAAPAHIGSDFIVDVELFRSALEWAVDPARPRP